jgi:general stress protein 26
LEHFASLVVASNLRQVMTTNDENIINRVWRVIEKVSICMMTTRFEGGLRARPLEVRPDRDENVIWFLTDRRGLKDDEVEAHPEVCLMFVYPTEKVYLSVTGRAFVTNDLCQTKELWNERQRAWWPGGPSDANLLLLRVELDRAEMWDGPASSAVAAFEFAKARLTGTKPNLGENRKVTVQMD